MIRNRRRIRHLAKLIHDVAKTATDEQQKHVIETFAQWMVVHGLTREMSDVGLAVERLVDSDAHVVPLSIKSARQLSPAAKEMVVSAVEKELNATARTTWTVDPLVVGGIEAQTEDMVIHASVAAALQQL